VKKPIDAQFVMTAERRSTLIAGCFVAQPPETHAPDPARINLAAREPQVAATAIL
jgi:hypothetical protein